MPQNIAHNSNIQMQSGGGESGAYSKAMSSYTGENGEEDGVVNDRRLNNLENLRDAAPRVDIARCCSFLKSSNGRDSTMASAKHLCAASII